MHDCGRREMRVVVGVACAPAVRGSLRIAAPSRVIQMARLRRSTSLRNTCFPSKMIDEKWHRLAYLVAGNGITPCFLGGVDQAQIQESRFF